MRNFLIRIGLWPMPKPYGLQFERRANPSADRMALQDLPGVGRHEQT